MLKLNLTTYLAAALLLALCGMGYHYQRAERFQEKAKAAEDLSAITASALAAANESVNRCSEANRKIIDAARLQATQLESATDNVYALAEQLASVRDQLKRKEEQDRANPKCQIILQSDIAAVCPSLADSVRKRAGGLQRPRNPDPGASTSPDPGRTD